MKDVVDPELGINVVDLGLVYGLHVEEDNSVTIDMTLTSAACPLTDVIEDQTQTALDGLVSDFRINWVWMPPWGLEMISEDGREQLRALGFNPFDAGRGEGKGRGEERKKKKTRDLEIRAGPAAPPACLFPGGGRGQDRVGWAQWCSETTLTKILSGEALPASGSIRRSGAAGYLPQDPRTGDLDVLAKNRILSARGLDSVVARLGRPSFRWPTTRRTCGTRRWPPTPGPRRSWRQRAATRRRQRRRGLPATLACLSEFSTSRSVRCLAASDAASNCRGSCSLAPRPCCLTSRPPPGCRLDHLAAQFPSGPLRWLAGHQPRCRSA